MLQAILAGVTACPDVGPDSDNWQQDALLIRCGACPTCPDRGCHQLKGVQEAVLLLEHGQAAGAAGQPAHQRL